MRKKTNDQKSAVNFPQREKNEMLAIKGVGPTVISRLEQIGFSSLSQLVGRDPLDITFQISQMMRSTCWHNSPSAKNAITAIVELANQSSANSTKSID
jgi:hypothetical protein